MAAWPKRKQKPNLSEREKSDAHLMRKSKQEAYRVWGRQWEERFPTKNRQERELEFSARRNELLNQLAEEFPERKYVVSCVKCGLDTADKGSDVTIRALLPHPSDPSKKPYQQPIRVGSICGYCRWTSIETVRAKLRDPRMGMRFEVVATGMNPTPRPRPVSQNLPSEVGGP
jgi:hypothetical protein